MMWLNFILGWILQEKEAQQSEEMETRQPV